MIARSMISPLLTRLQGRRIFCTIKANSLQSYSFSSNHGINEILPLWNPTLVGSFRSGHYSEVLNQYLHLKQLKVDLDGLAITFCLKSCVFLGRFEFGKGVHVDSFKVNLNSDCFVGSSLIGLYSEYGSIDDAYKVFDEITDKDVVAYTSMITAYAKFGGSCAYEAFKISYIMLEKSLHPNRVTLVSLLHTAAKLGALDEGRAIHGYATRTGIGLSDEIFETSLMDMYCKCGHVRMAASVLEKMDARSVGSWNTLIAAYLHKGQTLEAFHLFCQMMHRKIVPDSVTLANLIQSCTNLNYLCQGKSIHGYMILMGLEPNLVAITALVELYSKVDVTKARKIFERSENKDVVIYNVMMAGYLENKLSVEAVNVFREMVKMSIRLNVASLLNLVSAVSNLRDVKLVRSIHGYVLRHQFIMNVEIANKIIHTYAQCGYILYAKEVFNRMRYRDLVSWTSMMMGYVYNGHSEEAIVLFRLMQRQNLNFDFISLISLLQALTQLGCLGSVKEVHCLIYRVFHGRELSVNNSLITTYAKCGRIHTARSLFEQMMDRCLTSWNAIIAAYAMHGNSAEVLKLFDLMKSENVGPDAVTFTSILTACSHSGLVEEGLQFFRSMVNEYAIVPGKVHFSCVVDLLSRAGKLAEAYNLARSMPSIHTPATLSTLLSACRLYGDTETGVAIAEQILKLRPHSSGPYILASNVFAEGGRWDEVARIRAMTKDKKMKSTPGHSLIELDNQCIRCE